jgi:hypothetical protein
MNECPYCGRFFKPMGIARHKSVCLEKLFAEIAQKKKEDQLLELYCPKWLQEVPFYADWVLYEAQILFAEIIFEESKMRNVAVLGLSTMMYRHEGLYDEVVEWNPAKFAPVPGKKKSDWRRPVSRWSHDDKFDRKEMLRYIHEFLEIPDELSRQAD